MHSNKLLFITVAKIFVLVIFSQSAIAQEQKSNFTADYAVGILRKIKDEVKKNYYDPQFHGIDLDARFKTAEEKLKTADSAGQLMGIIAQVLVDFDDSHLAFLPPRRAYTTDYGWDMQAFGDNILVNYVKPKSNAEIKGLKVGDKIIGVSGFGVKRENLWKIDYMFRALRPQPGLTVIVEHPDGSEKTLAIEAEVRQKRRLVGNLMTDIFMFELEYEKYKQFTRSTLIEFGEDLVIWKMPSFNVDESHVSGKLNSIRKFKNVIIDLRGNGGGRADICLNMLREFFDKDIIVGTEKTRKETNTIEIKKSTKPYAGKVIVLLDSESASASELFSRVIQIEKRGIILGDHSKGFVMKSRQIRYEGRMLWALSLTVANLVMSDGKSLEKVGVTPDEFLLPTPADLNAKRDIVLSRAASIAGVTLTPEKAGTLFNKEEK